MEGCPNKAMVGSLMYAMMVTRTNIAFAESTVRQFMLKASPPHWMVVKRIMRYLKGTLDFRLCIGSKNIALRGFCIANWMGYANDSQSTTGTCFFDGVGVISWKCKKQPTIALSTT